MHCLLIPVARRADDRPVCPGQFDNMIAGGQPVTLSLKENVIKEAGEEAGVPPDLAATALLELQRRSKHVAGHRHRHAQHWRHGPGGWLIGAGESGASGFRRH